MISLSHGFGENNDVMFGQETGVIQCSAGDRGHAGGFLIGMNVYPDAVMREHGHQGFA